MWSSARSPGPMQVAAAMFTPASLIALATSASAPGRFFDVDNEVEWHVTNLLELGRRRVRHMRAGSVDRSAGLVPTHRVDPTGRLGNVGACGALFVPGAKACQHHDARVTPYEDQGYSSCWGRSSKISYHGALEPTNMWAVGLSVGSSTSVPYGTRTYAPSGAVLVQ